MSRHRYSAELADKIVDGLQKGHTKTHVARSLGLHEDTIRTWERLDERGDKRLAGFSARVKSAEEESQGNLISCVAFHSEKDWRAAAWLLERRWDDFKLKAKTSKEAQARLDDLSIEKSKAELIYTEAKTKALNRGSLSPEQILELLNRAREQGQQEGAEDAVH